MFASTVFLASCASNQNVVAEFGNNEITYDELKEAYYKNLSEEEKESEQVDEMHKYEASNKTLNLNKKLKIIQKLSVSLTSKRNLLLNPVFVNYMNKEKLRKELAIF
jgi:uncharacterized protein YeaO (DUF488 family)